MEYYCYGARYYDPRTSVWQSPDPILGEYMSGKINGGVFNPKNLNMFGYTYNNPVNLVDPDGNNPGPVYLSGPLAKIDLQSGNSIVDNTVLDAVNTLFNFSNSVVNAGLNALAGYGDAVAPHEAAINSVASGVGPYGKSAGMAIIGSAKGANYLGKFGKIGNNADTIANTPRQALRNAKNANNIPLSTQPLKTIKPNTPEGAKLGLDNRNIKLYEYRNSNGQMIHIRQDKAATYENGGVGDQSAHFNAEAKNEKLKQHHYYDEK